MRIKPEFQILGSIFLLLFALAANAADPRFSGRYAPSPAIIGGGSISFYGSHFGTSTRRYTVKFGSYENLSRPMLTFRDGDFGSWADNRITIRMPAIITKEGSYWLRLYDGTRQISGVTFRAVLPTPTISRYLKTNVCPGESFTLIGRNFTNIRNVYGVSVETRAPATSRWFGLVMRNSVVTSWSNSHISIRLPTDSVYIKPGFSYKFSLVKRLTNPTRLRKVAIGPTAMFATRCRDTQGSATPSGTQRYSASFRLAPIKAQAYLGQNIFIGGTFYVTDRASLREFQRRAMRVRWSIRRIHDNKFIKSGRLRISSRRTPFLQRFKPAELGVYRLYLSSMRRDYRLNKPDLGLKSINVVAPPVRFRGKRPQKKLPYQVPQRRF
jgi:hypothetical protein